MGEPILVLDAIVPDRPYVVIKSTLHPESRNYEMHIYTELSLEELKTIEVLGRKASELQDAEDLTEADGAMLDGWLQTMMQIVFHTPLEPEVLDELTVQARLQVVNTFTEVCLKPEAARQAMEQTSSGAK